MKIRTLKEMADEIRARCPDPAPHANPLVDVWRHEGDGAAKYGLRMLAVNGDAVMVASVAAEMLARGCTPSVIAAALDDCHSICTPEPEPGEQAQAASGSSGSEPR